MAVEFLGLCVNSALFLCSQCLFTRNYFCQHCEIFPGLVYIWSVLCPIFKLASTRGLRNLAWSPSPLYHLAVVHLPVQTRTCVLLLPQTTRPNSQYSFPSTTQEFSTTMSEAKFSWNFDCQKFLTVFPHSVALLVSELLPALCRAFCLTTRKSHVLQRIYSDY